MFRDLMWFSEMKMDTKMTQETKWQYLYLLTVKRQGEAAEVGIIVDV
jgi:hypothetical protein